MKYYDLKQVNYFYAKAFDQKRQLFIVKTTGLTPRHQKSYSLKKVEPSTHIILLKSKSVLLMCDNIAERTFISNLKKKKKVGKETLSSAAFLIAFNALV